MEMKWWRFDWFAWLIRWWICLLVKSSAGDWSPHMVFSCWRPPPQQPVLGSVIAARSQAARIAAWIFVGKLVWGRLGSASGRTKCFRNIQRPDIWRGEKTTKRYKTWDGKKQKPNTRVFALPWWEKDSLTGPLFWNQCHKAGHPLVG